MLKNNIIAIFLYLFISICFFESCVECPTFTGMTMLGLIFIFLSFIYFFFSSFMKKEKNKYKKISNIAFHPVLVIFCVFLGFHIIDFINYLNLNWKYDAMFKFRSMDWNNKISCENNICNVPYELTFKLGKYVAKNGSEYIFPKISIGGYNAFVIANDYNLVYEKYNYFNTTFSDYVYIIDYDISSPQKD